MPGWAACRRKIGSVVLEFVLEFVFGGVGWTVARVVDATAASPRAASMAPASPNRTRAEGA